MKKLKLVSIIFIIAISVTSVLNSGGVSEQIIPSLFASSNETQIDQGDEITQNIRKLELLYRLVERDFLFDIDHKAVYEEMAKGLFEGLKDEYSAYIVSKESTDFSEDTLGTYGGIGAYISKNYLDYRDFSDPKTYMINITSVFPGSPAESAGLMSGDLISHIDGEPVDDLEADEASKSLKGEAGTVVVLTIKRGDVTFDVKVTRKNVQIPTVSASKLDNNIGYVQITQFTESTAKQVQEELMNININSLSSLIIDLRNNPGGIVDSTLRIADMILDDGKIVQIHSKNVERDKVYVASKSTLIPKDLPIVLLVNGGSASSSEILAGALKDNNRATLIGTTTYGKGLIQVVSPFEDGYYTLTWSQYKTPNGDDIHKVGIPVDIEIQGMKVDEENMESYLEFINSGVAETFAKENPAGAEQDYKKFIEQYMPKDAPLDELVYRIVLRREYLRELPFEERPLADIDFDPVLKRAVDFLTTGE